LELERKLYKEIIFYLLGYLITGGVCVTISAFNWTSKLLLGRLLYRVLERKEYKLGYPKSAKTHVNRKSSSQGNFNCRTGGWKITSHLICFEQTQFRFHLSDQTNMCQLTQIVNKVGCSSLWNICLAVFLNSTKKYCYLFDCRLKQKILQPCFNWIIRANYFVLCCWLGKSHLSNIVR